MPHKTLIPVVLSLALLAPAARASNPDADAQVLLDQGRKLEKEGKPEVALELYKAALLVAPKNAEAHRLAAGSLYAQKRCEEAIPEYRAFLDLASAKEKATGDYSGAVVNLATCLRDSQAVLEVHPSSDARCAVDGGPAKDASATAPATFEVTPGEHAVSCTHDGRFPANEKVIVAAKETKRLNVELAPLAGKTEVAMAGAPAAVPAPVPAAAPAAGDAGFGLPSLDDSKPDQTAPAASAPQAPPPPAGMTPDAAMQPGAATLVVSAPTPGNAPDATAPAPAPTPAPAAPVTPPPPATSPGALGALNGNPGAALSGPTGEIRIETQGGNWTCQVDGGAFVSPDTSGNAFLTVSPGNHVVGCDRPGSEHVEARLSVDAGAHRLVRVKPYPKAGTPEASADAPGNGAPAQNAPSAEAKAPETVPDVDPHAGGFEFQLQGGISAGLGTFGIGAGVRHDAWGLSVGTGIYAFGLTGTYFFNPGRTGFYVSAGYLRVSAGPLGALQPNFPDTPGHGVWAGGGIDVRPDENLSFRLGLGLGANTTGLGEGPLVLDLAVAYVL